MRRGGVVPPGKAGLLVIAATLAPIMVRRMKPAVRAAGKGLVKAGEFVQKMAEEATQGTRTEASTPNGEVKKDETTKVSEEAAGTHVTTASPTGQEELERQAAVEAAGDGAVTEPTPVSPKEKKKQKKLEPDQKLNPKRTRNSQPK